MIADEAIHTVWAELEAGIALPKCRQCGCMEGTLNGLASALPGIETDDARSLQAGVAAALEQMRPVRYSCLGCEHCYPAVAQNAFSLAFPAKGGALADLSCDFQAEEAGWPPVVGEYTVVDATASVAVSTLASVALADALARLAPDGLAIAGKTETENIGIDKVVKNVVTSPTLRYLIVAGRESQGHLTGETLVCLAQNGVDETGRVIGSRGKRPILRNVSPREIEAFREQVRVVDMIGCEDADEIAAQVAAVAREPAGACGCGVCCGSASLSIATLPKVIAAEPVGPVKLDPAGYFVIVPLPERGVINVEHYAYDNSLLRVIEGPTARAVYATLIDQGWVTELSHAAYLGKELVKAELSLELGFKFVQDGA